MKYKNIEIQFLRVVAIAMVIMMHAPLGMFHPYTEKYSVIMAFIHPAVGVDIFFVISGYLMGKTFLHRTADTADLSDKISCTAAFYMKRFWRLFPASFFWATFILVAGTISRDPEFWPNVPALYKSWVASILCFKNFEESLHPTHLGYFWSLSMENQFYLFLPICWFFLFRRWFWRALTIICVIFIFWRPGGQTWWLFRFDGLLMGLLLYRLTTWEAFRNAIRTISPTRTAARVLMTAFLCLLIPSVPLSIGAYPSLTWSIVALLSAVLVGQAVLDEGIIHVPQFLRGTVYWLGEFSYSIYLCHIPIWLVFKDIIKRYYHSDVDPFLLFGISIATIIVAAAVTYFTIEQPLMGGNRTRRAVPAES